MADHAPAAAVPPGPNPAHDVTASTDEDEHAAAQRAGAPVTSAYAKELAASVHGSDLAADPPPETSPQQRQGIEQELSALKLELPLRSAWLEKRSGSSRSGAGGHAGAAERPWKRRWFVLRADRLAYYRDDSEYVVLGICLLEDVQAVAQVRLGGHEHVFAVATAAKTFLMQCASRDELVAWVRAVRQQWKRVRAYLAAAAAGQAAAPLAAEFAAAPPARHTRDVSDAVDPALLAEQRNQILSDSRALMQGYLDRLSTGNITGHTWKRKWVVLRNGQLSVYKDDREYLLQRLVPLTSVLAIVPVDAPGRSHEFCFKVIQSSGAVTLCAASAAERAQWVETLSRVHSQMVHGQVVDEGVDPDFD